MGMAEPFQFKKHYTLEEARQLLPQIRSALQKIRFLRERLATADQRMASLLKDGHELGGELVNQSLRHLAELRELLLGFHRQEIFLKDVDRGLVDFPSLRNGREIFLCWEEDDEDIEFWHDIEAGYAGRERL